MTDLGTTLKTAGAVAALKNEESTCPDLDFQTRLIGFIVQGVISLIMVVSNLFTLDVNSYLLTIGIIILFTSTLWLMNYKTLLKKMLEPIRFVNAMILFGCMVACIVLHIFNINKSIILIVGIVEACAAFWYLISFIPFAQTLLKNCSKSCFNACFKGNEEA